MTGMAVALLAVALLLLATGCAGRDFIVGGRGGWTANPAEPFNHWAERNRFQVNDRLVFRYKGQEDSVLVVNQSHYDACNTSDPFMRLGGGESGFVLSYSGPHFFISGDAGRCHAGERLIVVVLAVRATPSPAPSKPSPPPKSSPSSPPPAPAAAGNSSTSPPQALAPPAAGNSSTSPPPAPALPAAGNSSTSPPPELAPPPVTNGTVAPPPSSPSSASALRGGFLACLVIAGAIVLA
ncbi:early nodulin-like protein 2 [Triticum urartu]|nr:early nodulin-like protein 2 [Triticum urartu]